MLTELIAMLEAAQEAGRELDERIAAAILGTGIQVRLVGDDGPPIRTFRYPDGSVGDALRYTSSLDAALTLIPEGLYWLVGAGKVEPDEPLYGAQILRTAADVIADGQHDATAALALCIAALKARFASDQPTSHEA